MKDAKADIEDPKVVTTDNSSSKHMLQEKRRLPISDRLRGLLLSVSLQSALQIAAGTFVACLFTFVRAISFPQSCVIATLFLVVSVMSSPNNHLGTRINAAASLVGCIWIGSIPAAVVATLAKLPGPGAASTGIYVALGAVAIAVLSINRVGSSPPMLWSLGMTSCLAFGLVALSTWKLQTIAQVWSITGYLLLVSVIAAVVSTLAAALVMPTLATEQVHAVLTDVLQSAGLSTSRYAARLFRAQPAQQASLQQQRAQLQEEQRKDVLIYSGVSAAALGRRHSPDGHIEVSMNSTTKDLEHADRIYALGDAYAAFVTEDTMTEAEWLQLIQRNSSPNPPENPKAYKCPLPVSGVGMLRPKLAEVQNLLLPAAAVEPHWLRVPSLLSCGGPTHWFDAAAWGKVVGALQLLITRLSALEAVIEDGESLHESGGWISSPELLSSLRLVYSQTATSLALMASTVKHHNGPTNAAAQANSTDGDFCVMVGAFGAGWLRAKEELTAFMKAHTESYWERMMAAAPGSPVTLPSLTNVRHLMFSWVLTNSIITATEQLERALAAAVCHSPPASSPHRLFGWLVPLWPLLSGRHLFANWHKVLLVDLPAVIRQGSAGFSWLLPSPLFQAGVKYWTVLVLVYTATIIAMHFDSAIATLTPAFGYVAAVLTMSERVEATVSKMSFWFAGTIVGGGLGCLAMWHPAIAANPYALMAIMVAAAFLVGLLGHTRGRVAITLTLMTLSALILCQYTGVRPGRLEVAAARVVSVLAGVLLAVVVCNIVLPWYTSTWAIQTLCHVYEHSIQMLCELVAKSYQQGAEAVALAAQNHPEGPSPAVETAADLAATLAIAAAESFPDAAACGQARDPGDPAALQSHIARPLLAVQVSLMRDTVAWQKGVLATPPIVRELLKSLQSLADRLAALQLALKPPKVTGVMTGAPLLYFGVPLRDQYAHLFELHGILAAAVTAAVQHPESRTHANAIRVLVKSIEQQRVSMYRTMTLLRRDLHVRALQQQDLRAAAEAYAVAAADDDCPTAQKASQCMRQQLTQYFGTSDDAVAYLGFQFALLKAVDKAAAVAKLVLADFC